MYKSHITFCGKVFADKALLADVQKEFERSTPKVKDRSQISSRNDKRVTTIAIDGVEEKKELVDYIVERAQV